jgi:hypothetical protein
LDRFLAGARNDMVAAVSCHSERSEESVESRPKDTIPHP